MTITNALNCIDTPFQSINLALERTLGDKNAAYVKKAALITGVALCALSGFALAGAAVTHFGPSVVSFASPVLNVFSPYVPSVVSTATSVVASGALKALAAVETVGQFVGSHVISIFPGSNLLNSWATLGVSGAALEYLFSRNTTNLCNALNKSADFVSAFFKKAPAEAAGSSSSSSSSASERAAAPQPSEGVAA